jgi:hypothetical protein
MASPCPKPTLPLKPPAQALYPKRSYDLVLNNPYHTSTLIFFLYLSSKPKPSYDLVHTGSIKHHLLNPQLQLQPLNPKPSNDVV